MSAIRDRESLLRGYERELGVAKDDPERTEAIKAEIERVKALPPVPAAGRTDTTPAERESARAHAYLAGLRKERDRSSSDRQSEIDAEIARVEGALAQGPLTERAREVPEAEHATSETPSERATDNETPHSSPRGRRA